MRARREQLGQHAVARGDVEHVAGLDQLQHAARERFPGAAGRVVPFHVAGDGVGPAFGARALGQHGRQAHFVVAQQRVVDAFLEREQQRVLARIDLVVVAVVRRHAGAAIAHEPGLLELGKMRRHARLGEAQHGRELGHGQLLAFEQGQQAHARRIGEQPQQRGRGGEIEH